MRRWQTVVPVHNLRLAPIESFEFAEGVVLSPVPPWVTKDKFLEELSRMDRESVLRAGHALVVEYEAASLGDPDPNWTGSRRRSIQESKYQLGVLANFALWLSRPSTVCFTLVFHCPHYGGQAVIQAVRRYDPLLCHPNDVKTRISRHDIELAINLHTSLVRIPIGSAVWTAIHSAWAALQINSVEIRYSLLWVALEALFGPEDGREITYRISQRMALCLAPDGEGAEKLFRVAKDGYSFRSKVVHGRWKENPKIDVLMAEAEKLVRDSLVRLLVDPELMKKFLSADRENYLDGLAFLHK